MRCILLFISLICWGLHGRAQDEYDLNGKVSVYKETQQHLNFRQAWEQYIKGRFTPANTPENELNLGFVLNIYWVAIPVENITTERKYVTGIANGGIFELEYYLADSSGNILMQHKTGDVLPFSSRSLPNRHFYFPLRIPPQSKAVIFYRVNMLGNGLFLPLRIAAADHLDKMEFRIYMTYAFFCGFLLFVAFFSMAAFLWTRDQVYMYYSLYIICYCLFFLADGDIDFELLYPNWPGLASITPITYGLGINFFMLLFMRDFLHLRSTHSLLYRVTKGWVLLLILEAAFIIYAYVFSKHLPLRQAAYIVGAAAVIGTWVLQIWGIVQGIRNRYKPAYLYGIALLCVFITAMIYVFHSFALLELYIPSWLYVPIGFSAEIVILTIALIYSYNFYRTRHQQLTLHLAHQQVAFSRQLLEVQETEQKRIAQDLHDELGGNLAAIKMNLQSIGLTGTEKIMQLVDHASSATRTIAHNLMPPQFEETELPDLLRHYFEGLKTQEKIVFNLYITTSSIPFNKQEQLLLYRTILELVNNTIRHSGATECTLQLLSDNVYLILMCEDNGHGFDPSAGHGIGLKSIQSRVNFLNGSVHIDSGIHGTTILIKVPIKNNPA